MNFKANANSTKARTTFKVFIQPPDFGNVLSIPGKKAKRVNGTAIPREKPSIPMIGFKKEPSAEPNATAPAMGNVQENETNTKVNAMKNTPTTPPLLSILADLLIQLLGSAISK